MRRSWKRKWRPRGPGGRRPPTRWIDGSSQGNSGEPCLYSPIPLPCSVPPNTPTAPLLGVYVVASGEVDLDWADKSESRLDRVVGDIGLKALTTIAQEDEIVWPDIRLGMLVAEEIDDITTWNPPNLWDHDHLEEFEWMWLYQTQVLGWDGGAREESWPSLGSRSWFAKDVHVDLHVRRKLGKADHLVIVGQFSHGISAVFNSAVGMACMLRAVFVN